MVKGNACAGIADNIAVHHSASGLQSQNAFSIVVVHQTLAQGAILQLADGRGLVAFDDTHAHPTIAEVQDGATIALAVAHNKVVALHLPIQGDAASCGAVAVLQCDVNETDVVRVRVMPGK